MCRIKLARSREVSTADDVKAPDVGGSFVDLGSLSEQEKTLLARFIRGVHKSSAHFTWKSEHGLDIPTYREAAGLNSTIVARPPPTNGRTMRSAFLASREKREPFAKLLIFRI